MCEIIKSMCCCCCCCCKKESPDKPIVPSRPSTPPKDPKEDNTARTLASILTTETWNLTTPAKSLVKKNRPHTVEFPELKTFEDQYFKLTAEGLVLAVPVDGYTTPGSKYSRCEFRELDSNKSLASWKTSSGFHRMEVITKVEKTPENKPHICLAQIHDSKDDIVMVRYEGGKIIVSGRNFVKKHLLDVKLKEEIKIVIECSKKVIKIFVNEHEFEMPPLDTEGCYFKAGNYLQSNLTRDKEGEGVVILKHLDVIHQ